MTLVFKEFTLVFRAYDDGVAYHFESKLDPRREYQVVSEQAEFCFCEGSLLPLKLESNNPAMKLRDYAYVVVPALGGSDECVRAVLPSADGYADIYYSDAKDNTDCIVYFPGGGFANHTPGCISQIVDYCKGKGITLAIVMYRLGGHHWGQWQDFPASMFEWIASLHAE